jgi:hypothetical protein
MSSGESCNCGPGQSANMSSSIVRRAAESAVRADRLALLGRLRGADCCQGKVSSQAQGNAISGTAVAADLSRRTIAEGPKGNARVLTAGVYIDNLRRETIEASRDQFNPDTRFSRYDRYQPPEPCPTYVRNPAVPVAPAGNCYPSRFYGSGKYY